MALVSRDAFCRQRLDERLVQRGLRALAFDTSGKDNGNVNTSTDRNSDTARDAFEKAVEPFAGSQARLGDELATLPGPTIDFQSLMRLVITWSASLASSIALYLLVWNAFKAISGTEEAHNQLKRVIIQVLIGLTLVLFSYVIVSTVMGLIWAS